MTTRVEAAVLCLITTSVLIVSSGMTPLKCQNQKKIPIVKRETWVRDTVWIHDTVTREKVITKTETIFQTVLHTDTLIHLDTVKKNRVIPIPFPICFDNQPRIIFTSRDSSGGQPSLPVDAVPEPATLWLVGAGLGLVGLYLKRRKA